MKPKRFLRRVVLKTFFRQITRVMFSQISRDGRYANTTFTEGTIRHDKKSIEALLVELSQMDC